MADERLRITDDSPLSSSVPDAPVPLAKSVLERFRYGAKKAAAQVSSSPEGVSKDAAHVYAPHAPTFSQTTSHRAGLKIRALDINQYRTHVVLAGGKLLKTVRVDQEPSCTEDFNLHTVAVNYAGSSSSQNAMSVGKSRSKAPDFISVQRDMFDIEDVAWSNNEFRDYIATAARNGKIMLYDMNRPGVEVGSFQEHYRQVHKVDFNPMEGACLLSGSQDGTVRLWDLRNYSKSAILRASMNTFAGRSEGVRHVKWSPRDTWSFAFGTDNGVIQRWDTRNHRKPVLKFSAHQETCNSIDWHPDGRHLVSAGKDRIVKVWDISPDALGRALFHVRTPREVQNVRWRPSCFVMEPHEFQTMKQCTHFATSYRNYPVVQVWDLRRPHMPFREVHHQFNSGTTDMLWRSRDLLWTVGPEGEFNQTDVPFEPKTIDRRPLVSVSCGSGGQVTFVSQNRTSSATRRWESPERKKDKTQFNVKSSSKVDRFPFGRSPGDDSFDEKFLEPTIRRSHSRAASIKSGKSLGITPPSTEEMLRMVTTDLKTSMNIYEAFKPSQSARTGLLPGALQSDLFVYMHQNYKTPRSINDIDLDYLENIGSLFEQNAEFAERASLYRDAQMWRILGLQIYKDLKQRQKANQTARLQNKGDSARHRGDPFSPQQKRSTSTPHATSGKHHTSANRSSAVFLTERPSNTATPVVHAMEKKSEHPNDPQEMSAEILLPPVLEAKSRAGSVVLSSETGSEGELFGSLEIEGNTERKSQTSHGLPITQSPSLSRAPHTVDVVPGQTKSIQVPSKTVRRTSSESLWRFSTSSDSTGHRLAENSLPSNRLRNPESFASEEDYEEAFNFNSSFQSAGSVRSNSPSGYALQETRGPNSTDNHESFFDLPTHGNLRLDDFVDSELKQVLVDKGKLQDRTSSTENSGNFDSSIDQAPSIKRPQYRLAGSAEPIAALERTPLVVSKTQRRQNAHVSTIVPSEVATIPENSRKQNVAINDHLEETFEDEGSLLSDYLQPNETQEVSDDIHSAIKSREMIPELLKWYASKGDALTAAHIFLYTVPLLGNPRKWSSNSTHHSLTSPDLSLNTLEAAPNLQEQHATLKSLGLSPEFVESILASYHDELVSLDLMESAAAFRSLVYPSFPAVYEQGLKDVQIHLLCLGCSRPINNPRNKMECESCRKRQEDCSICLCAQSPFDWELDAPLRNRAPRNPASSLNRNKDATSTGVSRGSSSLWTTCLICNHSTHAACADQWFADTESEDQGSGGACPVPGCLCDCVRGWYRNERLAKLEKSERQKRLTASSVGMSGGVRRDKWNVAESRAVGKVRGALRDPRMASSIIGEYASNNSERPKAYPTGYLAEQGRTMSDEGKRVRLVAPEDDGQRD